MCKPKKKCYRNLKVYRSMSGGNGDCHCVGNIINIVKKWEKLIKNSFWK